MAVQGGRKSQKWEEGRKSELKKTRNHFQEVEREKEVKGIPKMKKVRWRHPSSSNVSTSPIGSSRSVL